MLCMYSFAEKANVNWLFISLYEKLNILICIIIINIMEELPRFTELLGSNEPHV